MVRRKSCPLDLFQRFTKKQVEDMMVQINADKEEAEVVRVKVEAEEATANEKARFVFCYDIPGNHFGCCPLFTFP